MTSKKFKIADIKKYDNKNVDNRGFTLRPNAWLKIIIKIPISTLINSNAIDHLNPSIIEEKL